MKATCWFAEVSEVTEVIDNKKYWGQKAKDIKATEAEDIEVNEARDIEAGKAIEIAEVTEFSEFLEPQIDTTRKEPKPCSISRIFSLQIFFVNFVNKSTNFLVLVVRIIFFSLWFLPCQICQQVNKFCL